MASKLGAGCSPRKRRELQARLSEWDARLEYEERRKREIRARLEREARLEDDDGERRDWEVRHDSRFDRQIGSMRLKHEPFQEEQDSMFEPVRLDSDPHSQPQLDLDRSDYRYVPARDWFQRDAPDVNSHRVRRDSRQPVVIPVNRSRLRSRNLRSWTSSNLTEILSNREVLLYA